MATFVATSVRPYVGALDLTALTEKVSFGDITAQTVSFTNMAAGGHVENKPGLISGEFSIDLFQDTALGGPDDILGTAGLGTQYAVTLLPNPGDTNAAGDPAYLSRGTVGKRSPFMGNPGGAAKAQLSLPYDTKILRGAVGHPATARTATGTGTAVVLAGPSATQTLYATLHVIAYTGLTNAVIAIDSDDAVGFPSATTRLTFATVIGTTSQFASAVGPWAAETHHRVKWTLTGAGSVTFVVALAVF